MLLNPLCSNSGNIQISITGPAMEFENVLPQLYFKGNKPAVLHILYIAFLLQLNLLIFLPGHLTVHTQLRHIYNTVIFQGRNRRGVCTSNKKQVLGFSNWPCLF